jgi:hypothetical protein
MTVGQNITNITIITLQIGYEERIGAWHSQQESTESGMGLAMGGAPAEREKDRQAVLSV